MEKNITLWLACAAVYFSAVFAKQRPSIVPATIHLPADVLSEVPPGNPRATAYVVAGEHACAVTSWGAIFAMASDGDTMGIKPGECRVLTWRAVEPSKPLSLQTCLEALGIDAHRVQMQREVYVSEEPHLTAASLWEALSPIIYGVLYTFEDQQQRANTFGYLRAAIGASMAAEFGKPTAQKMIGAVAQGIAAIDEAGVN